MFAGEVYSDFVLLWLMVHATRFAAREADRPDSCWLEQWAKQAEEQGTRALRDLRVGVEHALQIFGEGFTGHRRIRHCVMPFARGRCRWPTFTASSCGWSIA